MKREQAQDPESLPDPRVDAAARAIGHYQCDDCWYSCPQSEEGCCDEEQGTDCNCGLKERVERALAAADAVVPPPLSAETIRGAVDQWTADWDEATRLTAHLVECLRADAVVLDSQDEEPHTEWKGSSLAGHNHDRDNDFDYEVHYNCPACFEQTYEQVGWIGPGLAPRWEWKSSAATPEEDWEPVFVRVVRDTKATEDAG